MIGYNEALEIVLNSTPLSATSVLMPLEKSLRRVAAQAYVSDQNIPPFRSSSMDGFAVKTQTLSLNGSKKLKVRGSIAAGDSLLSASVSSESMGAWEIMTGAPLPEGYDAVIKVEDVSVSFDAQGNAAEIEIFSLPEAGQYCRAAGEDMQKGTPLLQPGAVVFPEHVLALSAVGVTHLQVLRPAQVVIISTGKELMNGQIRNSTAPYLALVLEQMGATVDLYQVGDSAQEFMQLLTQVWVQPPDLILTTGGVSMGKHDYVAPVLRDLGAQILFHQVAMRPGKPHLFAELPSGTHLFGLPGNPISTVVGFRFLVEPYLRKWQRRSLEKPERMQLAETVQKPLNLRCFMKAAFSRGEQAPQVHVWVGQESFRVQPLLETQGWVVLPEGRSEVLVGTWVDVYPFRIE